jgi:hypothetical protein
MNMNRLDLCVCVVCILFWWMGRIALSVMAAAAMVWWTAIPLSDLMYLRPLRWVRSVFF